MRNLNIPKPLSGGTASTRFYDSYEHFSSGPFINIRDAQGNEMICRIGGVFVRPWTTGPASSPEIR